MVTVFTNVPALVSARALGVADALFSQANERISTGRRINRPSDDVGGFSISDRLRSRVVVLEGARAGVLDGLSLVQTADAGIESILKSLQRMQVLARNSMSGTATSADRTANNNEFQSLVSEITRVASTTEFNGRILLNGAFRTGVATLRLQLGPEAGSFTALNIRTLNSTALGLADENVSTVLAASAALITVTSALNVIVRPEAGNVGGRRRRIENALEFLDDQRTALATGISAHVDADIAQELINRTRAQILRDMSSSSLVQAQNFRADSVRVLLGIGAR
jgi:flagellin